MIKQLLFTMLIALFASSITAQSTGHIQGKIMDAKQNQPLPGANVAIVDLNKGATADKNGLFVIKDVPVGKHVLKVQYQGYFTKNISVEVKKGESTKMDVELSINVRQLTQVEIKDDKIELHPYSKVTIKRATLEQEPVRDIGDFLRTIPNVGAIRKGGANLDPVIRGFKYDQLNIQVDNGLRMEGGCPNRMDPTSAHVEAADIEAIEVLKGPFALRYGPTMGGVVNMLTINPRPFDSYQVHVKTNFGYESNWNGQRQHFTVLGGNQHVFYSMTGNNALYGNYTDGDGNTVPSSFRKMGFTGKLGFSPAKGHIITGAFSQFYARDLAFPALPMDERTDNTNLYSFDYKGRNISDVINSVDFKAYYTFIDHTMDNKERSFGDTVAAVSNIIATKMGYRFETGLNVLDGHLFVGSDYYRIDKDGVRDKHMIMQNPKPNGMIPLKIEDLWNEAVITNLGFFAEYKRKVDTWEFVAAARLDMNNAYSDSISLTNMMGNDLIGTPKDSTESNFTNVSFSLGATKNLTDKLSIGASFGRGVRSGNMIERFIILLPVGYDNFEYLGNPELKPEANNEFDLVIKYTDRKIGAFELTGFYSIVNDYIGGIYIPKTIQKPLTSQVLGVKQFDNLGTATMMGFEFAYALPNVYKWTLSATAAYTMGSINEVEVFVFDANNNAISSSMVKDDPLAEIPPLDAKIRLGYKLFDGKLIPEIGFRYVAAQNRASAYNFEPTTESFNLLNFSLLYRYNDYVTVSAGVNNMLDVAYAEHLNRRVLGTNYRIQEPGRIFFLNIITNF
jgi:iron complex outermembrane receptor protein